MDMSRKIMWKRGMEITPATFEAADNFWESSDIGLRRLIALRSYGIVPDVPANVNLVLSEETVTVYIHSLEGITRSGRLFQIEEDKNTIYQPKDKGMECYLTLHIDDVLEQKVNGLTYCMPHYAYHFCTLAEIDADCLPFAKLVRTSEAWKIQEMYIPPCVTVGSDSRLAGIVSESRENIEALDQSLKKHISGSDAAILRLLCMESENFRMTEPPYEYYLLLNKIATLLSTISISVHGLPHYPENIRFEENDMLKSINPLIQYIRDYNQAVSSNVPVEEEKPVKPEEPAVEIWDAVL